MVSLVQFESQIKVVKQVMSTPGVQIDFHLRQMHSNTKSGVYFWSLSFKCELLECLTSAPPPQCSHCCPGQ